MLRSVLRSLEKYELIEELGHGGMATVYRARDTQLDRMVAVKVLHPHLQRAEEARARFTREAKSVARLKHPNILEIYDYSGEDSEESFIVTELLTGPTLKVFGQQAEARSELPAEVALCIALQIARALEVAHTGGIVHRDVKPENVLLHEARGVKLTDFGVAQMVGMQSLTATGQVLGSPGHMAPEQLESGTSDVRSDVFGLGTILYFLAVGQLPFEAKNPHQAIRKVLESDYPDPPRVRPSIGTELATMIRRCLACDPNERYPTVTAFASATASFLERGGVVDADMCFTAYLTNPKEASARLREEVVTRWTAWGIEQARADRISEAYAAFDRVLSLDEGNEEVLAWVRRLTARAAWWRGWRGVLCLLGLGAALVFFVWSADVLTSEQNTNAAPFIVDLDAKDISKSRAVDANTDANTVDASGTWLDMGAQMGSDMGAEGKTFVASTTEVEPRAARVRRVVFQPTPQNIRIGIDGASPRAFGPSFREVQLTPGRHRFRMIGGAECCEDARFAVNIPSGNAPYVLAKTLRFRPARLYVVSTVPNGVASVRVSGRGGESSVRGRARQALSVPMGHLSETRLVTVSAQGYLPQTLRMRLRAGQMREQRVVLQRDRHASASKDNTDNTEE